MHSENEKSTAMMMARQNFKWTVAMLKPFLIDISKNIKGYSLIRASMQIFLLKTFFEKNTLTWTKSQIFNLFRSKNTLFITTNIKGFTTSSLSNMKRYKAYFLISFIYFFNFDVQTGLCT